MWYPIQVKQRDKTRSPDSRDFEGVMTTHDRTKGSPAQRSNRQRGEKQTPISQRERQPRKEIRAQGSSGVKLESGQVRYL